MIPSSGEGPGAAEQGSLAQGLDFDCDCFLKNMFYLFLDPPSWENHMQETFEPILWRETGNLSEILGARGSVDREGASHGISMLHTPKENRPMARL